MKNNHLQHIFELLLATLFISTSGVLGKYIEMNPPVIVWLRSFLAAIFIYGYCRLKQINLRIKTKKDVLIFVLGGIFMAVHWITYFGLVYEK